MGHLGAKEIYERSSGRKSFNAKLQGRARRGGEAVGYIEAVEGSDVKRLYRVLRVAATLGEQGVVGRVLESRKIKKFFWGIGRGIGWDTRGTVNRN